MLLNLLAQISPPSEYAPPAAIKDWLECLFWFMAFVTCLVGVGKMLKPKPAMHDYVLQEEFDKRMSRMSEASKEFRDQIRDEQKKQGERLAKMETAFELLNQTLFQIENKLDRLIERR
jgi:hypothetical protein